MTGFNINQFRSVANINEGFQKTSKYLLRIHGPPGLITDFKSRNTGGNLANANRNLEFYCYSADLPGMALATRNIVRYGYGASEKKPFAPMYQDVMMTFYADGNEINLQFFHDWFKLISHNGMMVSIGDREQINSVRSAPYELAYRDEYVVDKAFLRLFDEHGHPKYEMQMRDFYPIAIPHTKLDWTPSQQVMSVVVIFTFTDWIIFRDSFDPVPLTLPNSVGKNPIEGIPPELLKNNVY